MYYLQSRFYDPEVGRFLNADAYTSTGQGVLGNNMFAYCNNNPIMASDASGNSPVWIGNVLIGIGIVVNTALFVGAIVASAGAVAALASVGFAAMGFATGAVATASSIATVATYGVAGGVALFGASDSIEAFSGGTNPVRDYVMGGNQSLYDTASSCFNTLGSIAVIAGMVAPKVMQTIADNGTPKYSKGKLVGHSLDFFDTNGDWNLRIDATTHGNPNGAQWHHDPHYHVVDRGGKGTAVYYLWETIIGWLGWA